MLIKDEELVIVTNFDIGSNNIFYVPYGVKKIKNKAFSLCSKIKKLIIPSSVFVVEEDALLKLKNLEELVIGNSVGSICFDKKHNPKLSTITIDSNVSNHVLTEVNRSLVKGSNVNSVKILYKDYSIGYNETSEDFSIYAIEKLKSDRFQISLEDDKGNHNSRIIIDKDNMIGYNIDELINQDKYFDYLSIIYEGRYDALLDWENVINSNPKKYGDKLPSASIIKSIPTNEKCIKEFLLKRKKYDELIKTVKLNNAEKLIFNRLLYFIGYFDGDNKASNKATIFISRMINENIKDALYYFDFLKSEAVYDKNFASMLMDSWDYIYHNTEKPSTTWNYNDFEMIDLEDVPYLYKEAHYNNDFLIGNLLIKQLYDSFDLIYKESIVSGIPLKGKNVVDLLSKVKYNVRRGNEQLFDEMSKYIADYDVVSFNKIQEVYEKAKVIYKENTKRIKTTIDTSNNTFKYQWLDPLDPKNFTLGHRVNCCARLNNAGEGIMITSVLDPEVSNLVFKNKENKIIAKATAYYNVDKKYILFNNVEVKACKERLNEKEIYKSLMRAVRDQVKENSEIDTIAIGMAYNDITNTLNENCDKVPFMKTFENNPYRDYEGHRYIDFSGNEKQCILWKK